MRSTKRESLLDVMVARTTGLVEMHMRQGNEQRAIEEIAYAFRQLRDAAPTPKALNDSDHLVETELGMRTISALERVGLKTVGDIRQYDPMKLMGIVDIGRSLAIQILEAVGAKVPKDLRTKSDKALAKLSGKHWYRKV